MEKFTNKLINETSPYLLQHAHNPVNWYAWGDEALQKAVKEDKPILVSIGYSACHWCHVMEHESFEDEATAKLMNDNFINIKIDREERPDLDHIYMDAVQAIAGNGGWPLNVFLTPGKKPFYGGTYFPPQRAFNRASWSEVLTGVSQLFKEKRNEVESQAEELINHIGRESPLQTSPRGGGLANALGRSNEFENIFNKQQCDEVFNNIMKQADKKWGGFGNAPKFPQSFTINYLLRYYHYTKNEEVQQVSGDSKSPDNLTKSEKALEQACLSLDKMSEGGIYDQIGGGFARYSTDAEWLAPHFEKMLYDNALLISSLSDAYSITKKSSYKKIIEQTIDFIERELMHEDGGFYSALDADSEGEEGKYYVWSYEEINEILVDDAKLFCEYYDVTPNGNWEHKNILRTLKPLSDFAKEKNINEDELEKLLKSSAEKLLQKRSERIKPQLDDKIILGWNALMVTALCKASASLGNEHHKKLAIKNFEFLFSKLKTNDSDFEFYHTYKNDVAKYPAFLDDYAYLIQSCIALQEITSEIKYLEYASSLTTYVLENFDSEENYFFYTNKKQKDVVVRKKEIYDSAIPSGNSVMATNLFYLSIIFNKMEWKQKAITVLQNLSEVIIKYPTSFGNWACLIIDVAAGVNEIAVVGKEYENMRDELLQNFVPNKVLQCSSNAINNYPLLYQKDSSLTPLLYLCHHYSCEEPVTKVSLLLKKIVNISKFN